MRRVLVPIAAAGLAAAALVPAFAGTPDGQGAQKSGLSPTQGDNNSQCKPGSGTQTNGFSILNTAGKIGSAQLTNGEVSLKGATPNTTYKAYIAQNNNCTIESDLKTNTVGNGNTHLQTTPGLSGSGYYVVIQDSGGNEVFASGPKNLE